MDWTPLYPVISALLASAITGGMLVRPQQIAQRNENVRNARKIALDAAIAEWSKHFELIRDVDKATGTGKEYRPLSDYLIVYLGTVDGLMDRNLNRTGPEEIAGFLMDMDKRQDELFEKYQRAKYRL